MKQISICIDKELHESIKINAIRLQKTMRQYILDIVKKDLVRIAEEEKK